ncbi:MAG TPA: hypothetical protein VHB72_04330 [Candidatus Saccharimonadales bacterium]|nr:hypothetical protein [Candidatus Saccharimonadales bacterium]
MTEAFKIVPPNIKEVYRVAKEVREGFEQRSFDPEVVWARYCSWVPDARHWDRGKFLDLANTSFPLGCCGLASAFLSKEVDVGYGQPEHIYYKSYPHTVLLGDIAMVDITADQFGGPRIYVGPMVDPWKG